MQIKVAQSAGFCFGVKEAVVAAENYLENDSKLTLLGEIVHNKQVVDDLLDKGAELQTSVDDIETGSTVLVRAHGIPPQLMARLSERGCKIIDKTCPFVTKIQKIAARAEAEGSSLIVAGNANHPEVIGILGNAERSECHVIKSLPQAEELIEQLKQEQKINNVWTLVSQTTFSVELFNQIKDYLTQNIENLTVFDTICYTTICRQNETKELAQNSDLVFVLGGANSSNTAKLVEVAQQYCRETYLIQRPAQVLEYLEHRSTNDLRIGITAGASTPERMIREVIQVMSEQDLLNQQTETVENQEVSEEAKEQTVLTLDDIAQDENKEVTTKQELSEDVDFSEFIDSIPQLKRGATIKGHIVRFDDDFVYVDVNDKTEGKIQRREFAGDTVEDLEQAVAEQREIDVYVRSIRNTEHDKEISLSKVRVDYAKHKQAIEKAYKEKTPVQVKVTNVVRDGVIASFGSVDLYIHRTQLELQVVEDLEAYRGQTLEVLITQFDASGKHLRVAGSRRTLLQRERKERMRQLWEEIEVGKEYNGVVRNLTDFGAFVDINGVDGLVHVSELSWDHIKHPSEVVSVGDHIKVFVKDVDRERKRISLGFRRPENDPYYEIEERFPVGSIVRGVVVRLFPFGAFVEIAPGVDALCHISQISTYRLNRPNDVLKEGMEVDARVLDVNAAERKISISIKDVEPINPEIKEEQPKEERKARKQRRKNSGEKEDRLPTTYTDATSGSSLSAVANISFSDEKTAEEFGLLTEQQTESEEEKVLPAEKRNEELENKAGNDPVVESVEEGSTGLELVQGLNEEQTTADAVVSTEEVAEEAPVTGEESDATPEQGFSL